jgi:hypothetical protein
MQAAIAPGKARQGRGLLSWTLSLLLLVLLGSSAAARHTAPKRRPANEALDSHSVQKLCCTARMCTHLVPADCSCHLAIQVECT